MAATTSSTARASTSDPDGGVYEGEWQDGKRHGQGKMKWPDGDVYEGEWQDGKRHGQGKRRFRTASSTRASGRDNKRHGYGTEKLSCGTSVEARWRHGVRQQSYPDPPSDFKCPISKELMDDPVVTDDGGTYERECIEEWLSTRNTDPETNAELESRRLVPNRALLRLISAWKEEQEPDSFRTVRDRQDAEYAEALATDTAAQATAEATAEANRVAAAAAVEATATLAGPVDEVVVRAARLRRFSVEAPTAETAAATVLWT